ncbi:hypothetical protein LJR016_004415 [Devosia sp. LjRoot16]|uniref:hypothetical protein n=1 Tax=Devosia sp. LjRoot16 TaxID=3342271 RepID=UPI003ECE1F7C
MNRDFAVDLLSNLLERAETAREKTFLTSREVEALSIVLKDFANGQAGSSVPARTTEASERVDSPRMSAVRSRLVIAAVNDADIPRDVLLCVDFGTSFSKAFASVDNGTDRPELVDLPIGDGSGGARLVTPSEVLIDDGYIYFGPRARQRLNESEQSADRLIDSIKQYITLNSDVSTLGTARLDQTQDPTQSLSRRDVLVLYLAHLMHLSETALSAAGRSPNVRRRFAHPAWPDGTKDKNEREMRKMMAEAIVLARSVNGGFAEGLPAQEARILLDQLKVVGEDLLPLNLIHEPVREATAAGAGALLGTPEGHREKYLIVDIGAGTTDVAGFHCVNNPDWDKSRVWEISGAAKAKNMAGNVLDNALQKLALSKSSLVEGSEEYRQAGLAIRRDRRIFKEQLFNSRSVIIQLPTDEAVTITLDEFLAYGPVVSFTTAIVSMVGEAASVVQGGEDTRINLVATGGGASLPVIKQLVENGVDADGRHISFQLSDAIAEGVRETNPDLVTQYPQIAVALGGSLPTLPEQRGDVQSGFSPAPARVMGPMYRS